MLACMATGVFLISAKQEPSDSSRTEVPEARLTHEVRKVRDRIGGYVNRKRRTCARSAEGS